MSGRLPHDIMHGTLVLMLRKLADKDFAWDEQVKFALYAICASPRGLHHLKLQGIEIAFRSGGAGDRPCEKQECEGCGVAGRVEQED